MFFLKLVALLQAIMPFVDKTNWDAVHNDFDKAIVDFKGGDFAASFNDLIDVLQLIVPPEGRKTLNSFRM